MLRSAVFGLLLTLTAVSPAWAAEPARRPNIVFILADDLGIRDLSCYGSPYHKTPHLDQLAKDGLRFTEYYSACPVCSPTRASLMTGRYPQRVNITTFLPGRSDRPSQKLKQAAVSLQLPLEEVTIAETLKAAGYATGHVGKWHLGNKGFGPTEQGFDSTFTGNKGDAENRSDRLAASAGEFIAANKDRPFFLYLAYNAPHIPLQAKADLTAKYQGKPQGGKQSNPLYAAVLEDMDAGIGRLLKQLDDLKLTENTIVIFASDNGGLSVTEGANTPATSNAPYREGKGHLYEGGIRDPFIVRWPGVVKPGTTTDQLACSIDLFPTLLEAAGVKPPAGRTIDGVSLMPVFKGGTLPERPLFWYMPHYTNQGGMPGGAVRRGDYKLIEFDENGRQELFNVRNDPSEIRNLIVDKPDVAKKLAAELKAWRKEVGARTTTPNPDYRPNPPAKDGTISMHARTAAVHGIMLRYEAEPHKETLGYWTRPDDWAEFEFTATKAGTYTVEVLQGCGKGSGGAEVEIAVGNQKVPFTVKDTGGFQKFETRDVGTVTLDKPGRYTLSVRPKSKPGVAVMDLRAITLKPKE